MVEDNSRQETHPINLKSHEARSWPFLWYTYKYVLPYHLSKIEIPFQVHVACKKAAFDLPTIKILCPRSEQAPTETVMYLRETHISHFFFFYFFKGY